MARDRDSFQTGSVRSRKTKLRGVVWELRYRVRDDNSSTGWRAATVTAPPQCRTRKDALKLLSEKMTDANGHNSQLSGPRASRKRVITFAEFVETDWRSYVETRELKPSTLYSHQSLRALAML